MMFLDPLPFSCFSAASLAPALLVEFAPSI
jgi:hypothetical protein